MKKLLSIILIVAMLASCLILASCTDNEPTSNVGDNGGDNGGDNDNNGDDTGNDVPPPPTIVDNVCDMSDANETDKFKLHGRTSVTTDGLACDASASGIEFVAYIEGDLKITFNVTQSPYMDEKHLTNESYFTLYVDGVRQENRIRVTSGESTVTVASFTEGAVRRIKLIKQTEAHCALCTIQTLSFRGYFNEKPADKKLLVEFIGDSITVGYGNLCTVTNDSLRGHPIRQDATQAYAYLTAEKLGADASLVCVSGMGIAKGWRPFTADDFFNADSYYRDREATINEARTPDVVVINLGTNDQSKQADPAALEAKIKSLINTVRKTYGEDTPIVWIHGMMGQGYWSGIQPVLKDYFGGAENGVYEIAVNSDNTGGGGHPGLAAHENYSKILTQFIRTKVLAD